jgi:hypothetical protein
VNETIPHAVPLGVIHCGGDGSGICIDYIDARGALQLATIPKVPDPVPMSTTVRPSRSGMLSASSKV